MLEHGSVILRPVKESDIADYEAWFTTDVEWQNWDGPWEVWTEDNVKEFIEIRRFATTFTPEIYDKLEIEVDGRHIGWVSRYVMVCNDFDGKTAVGLNLPPGDVRGRGIGHVALVLWLTYLFDKLDKDILYTQTWSGNFPMIALAKKIGFSEVRRIKDLREVHGQKYDALTFSISKDEFAKLSNQRS